MKQLFKDTVTVSVDDIVPDPNNPNKMTKEQAKSLVYSMEKFDDVMPIVVDSKTMMVADGHHRLAAYKTMGVKEIDVIKKDFKNAAERILFSQTMNKLRGQHDKALDIDVVFALVNGSEENLQEYMSLMAIEDSAVVMSYLKNKHPDYSLGYDEKRDQIADVIPVEVIPDDGQEPSTKLGDIYKMGNHLLLCGDCRITKDVNRLLDGIKPQLMLTDPPYGIGIVKLDRPSIGGSKPVTIKGKVGVDSMIRANLYYPVTGDDEPFDPQHLIPMAEHHILFGGNYYADQLYPSPGWLVWYKRHDDWEKTTFAECELMWTDFDIPSRMYSVIWMGLIKEGENGKRVHPTQKPVKLLINLLSDFSRKGDTIIDPYLGSGSTLIACEETGRICLGMEIEPYYCDIAIRRWEKYTGQKAEKLEV